MNDKQEKPEWMKDTESGVILGVSSRSYPSQGGSITVTVVLVQGSINDYAAYIAATYSENWTKRHGNKISFQEACVHFPGRLQEGRYRL